jgi:hypothetical protein
MQVDDGRFIMNSSPIRYRHSSLHVFKLKDVVI